MENNNDSYRQIIDLLKRSKPHLSHPDILEEKIMNEIRMKKESTPVASTSLWMLFGWTRIVWVRRALSAAAVILLFLLAYQQSVILKQISILNQQLIPGNLGAPAPFSTGGVDLLLYRLSAGRYQEGLNNYSDKQIEDLILSIDRMGEEYKELVRIIDEDPELRKLIEQKLKQKLEEENNEKVKL